MISAATSATGGRGESTRGVTVSCIYIFYYFGNESRGGGEVSDLIVVGIVGKTRVFFSLRWTNMCGRQIFLIIRT